jgi:hypothetical protein
MYQRDVSKDLILTSFLICLISIGEREVLLHKIALAANDKGIYHLRDDKGSQEFFNEIAAV